MKKQHKVGFELRTIQNLIKRRLDKTESKHKYNMTGLHGWIVGYMYENRDKDIFQKNIEEVFSIRRSTATAILQLLEKNSLITRNSVNYDARLKKLELTPKAIEMQKDIIADIDKMENEMVRGFTEEELDTLYNLLERLKKNLE